MNNLQQLPLFPSLGQVECDCIWTGTNWQDLRGRDIHNAFQTVSGKYFWPLDAYADEVNIQDIARGLANECRFGNQVPEFCSVAWHSVALSHVVPDELKQWALIHDTPEAYLSDIPRVLKILPQFKFLRDAEDVLMEVIAEHLGMEEREVPEDLDHADKLMSHTELLYFFGDLGKSKILAAGWGQDRIDEALTYSHVIRPMEPREAERAFMDRFNELF